jgi:hypothetical protein
MVNSIGELAGMMAWSDGFGWRISYSVVVVRTRYPWQTMAVEDFFPLFFVPQFDGLLGDDCARHGGLRSETYQAAENCGCERQRANPRLHLSSPSQLSLFEAVLEILANGQEDTGGLAQ